MRRPNLFDSTGAPGTTRTCDPLIRSQGATCFLMFHPLYASLPVSFYMYAFVRRLAVPMLLRVSLYTPRVAPCYSALEERIEEIKGKAVARMARSKKAESDWRKDKREHGGSVYEYKGNFYARVQYIDENGKRRDKKVAVNSRSEARRVFKQLREKLDSHGESALNAHDMTFKELAGIYKETKLVPAVIRDGKKVAGLRSHETPLGFLNTLVRHFGRRAIRTIKHSDLERFKLKRLLTKVRCGTDADGEPVLRERKTAGVHRELALLRAMFRFAQREGWIVKSPFETGTGLISKSAEVERERILSYAEEARLLAACTGRREHLKPVLITALDTGMRRGEMLKLEWPDVDIAERVIHVNVTNTKTEKSRDIGMTPRVHAALAALKEQAPPGYAGRVFGTTTVKHAFQSALREAKIDGFRFHDLRHTATTRMVRTGTPHSEIMKVTGHSEFATFMRYVTVDEEAARKAADRLAAYCSSQTVTTSESETVN